MAAQPSCVTVLKELTVCRKGANQVRLLTHGSLKKPGAATMLAHTGWETQDYRIRDPWAPVKSRL